MLLRVLRANEKPNLTRRKGMVGQGDGQECRPGARWLVALANHFMLLNRHYLICEMGSLNLDAMGGCESWTTQNGLKGATYFARNPLTRASVSGYAVRTCHETGCGERGGRGWMGLWGHLAGALPGEEVREVY